ncbi:MAG: hypothetical protein R3B90_20745 [Planctomycetaceae bacterium]
MSSLVENLRQPVRRSRRECGWVGMEIDPRGLKLAVVEWTPAGISLRAADLLVWPDDVALDDLDAFGAALDRSLADWQTRYPAVPARQVACGLPQDWLRTTQVSIASRDDAVVAAQAKELASRLAGAPADTVAWDYWVSPFQLNSAEGATEAGGTLTLNVAATDMVLMLERTLGRRGLELAVVDSSPFITARAAAIAAPAASQLAAAWDLDGLTLTWLVQGEPKYARRTENIPLLRAYEQLRQQLSVEDEDCRCLLAMYGLPQQDLPHGNLQRAIGRALIGVLDDLQHEIERTLRFIEQRPFAQRVENCLLTGDGAAIRGLDRELRSRISRVTRSWSLPTAGGSIGGDVECAAYADAAALSALPLLRPESM